MMLTEIILNACEASEYTGEITLYSEKCNTSEIHIKIINDTTVPASGFPHLEQMVQPFSQPGKIIVESDYPLFTRYV